MVMSTPICAMACIGIKAPALTAISAAAQRMRFMSTSLLVTVILTTVIIVVVVVATSDRYYDASG